jgi:predicted amidohydrolase
MLVGVAQIDPKLGELQANRERCVSLLEEAAGRGCELLVFPECASSGYMFESAEEAMPCAEAIPGGPFVGALEEACARLGVHAASGMLEREGDTLYNAAVLVGPDGLIGRYRKSHLPYLGVDRFVARGDEVCVLDTDLGRVGLEICYDIRFPELTRAIALGGAELIAHPTNWPVAGRFNAEVLTRARSQENRVFLLSANRVGTERWATFCGWSQICDVNGDRLAEAGETGEALLLAEIDLEEARSKELNPIPGTHEMDLFGDRRPGLYGALVAQHEPVNRR